MNLIDWNALFSNFLWILALAWLLAVVSMARWQAHELGIKLGKLLDEPKHQVRLNLGGLVFCLGLGLVADKTWEMALWILLSIIFLVQVVISARGKKG
jgi:hypothetical protein